MNIQTKLISMLVTQLIGSSARMCNPAQELGSYGMAPWGSSSNFVDSNAKWIAAPAGAVTVYLSYINAYPSAIAGKLHMLGETTFQVSLNGASLGNFSGSWNSVSYTKVPITLRQVVACLCFSVVKVKHTSIMTLIAYFWCRDRTQ
jgi:hypothetical protein